MPTVQPIPQTPLRDDPQQDSIWKRYLDDLRRSVSSSISSYSVSSIAASSIVGVVSVTGGGTGFSSYTIGDLLYADTTTSLARFADVATGNAVISGGISKVPVYGKIGLTTHVSGTLPVSSGGTGITAIGEVYSLLRSNSSASANEYTAWPTTRNSVLSGETLTIVSSRAYVTASPLVNEGTIVNEGTLLVL